ncbi:hypothetical protein CVT26_003310 [Gymnopilus dilepis]|uniref:Uncharacterized protein n=1 Tax=Gymnopilus dilepis TaxID=231916 RepID=A0A409Y4X0_9AGAR|nr:hypothetical protein CVT26_003310 [Gymnopilus dilepis]
MTAKSRWIHCDLSYFKDKAWLPLEYWVSAEVWDGTLVEVEKKREIERRADGKEKCYLANSLSGVIRGIFARIWVNPMPIVISAIVLELVRYGSPSIHQSSTCGLELIEIRTKLRTLKERVKDGDVPLMKG